MKYQLNINLKNFDLKHAGIKAIADCEHILYENAYKNATFYFNKSSYLIGFSFIQLIAQLLKWALLIEPGSLIITQYPLIGVNRTFKFFINILKAKQCKVACVIHDINTLRYQQPEEQVKSEIAYLNAYDFVISHNNIMNQWLKSKGLVSKTFPIQVFDYLYQEENTFDRSKAFTDRKTQITIAGNLNRGKFIKNLFRLNQLQFYLYGTSIENTEVLKQQNIMWKGAFEPESLVAKLEGTFGLIWDGDSIENCEGGYGNYIQYNNPHKLSLYLAAGLPIIIPVKAALSAFVEKNKIGITVENLNEIDGKISKVSLSEYNNMLQNIAVLKQKVKHGFYFSNAINKIEKEYAITAPVAETVIVNRKINRLKDEKINLQS